MEFKPKYKSKYNRSEPPKEVGVFYPKYQPIRKHYEHHKNYGTRLFKEFSARLVT